MDASASKDNNNDAAAAEDPTPEEMNMALDDDGDETDSSILANVTLIENPADTPVSKREEPPPGLQWHDDAILECFQLAVYTHHVEVSAEEQHQIGDEATTIESTTNVPEPFVWSLKETKPDGAIADVPPNDAFPDGWRPKSLPLPAWAATLDPSISGIMPDKPEDEAAAGPTLSS